MRQKNWWQERENPRHRYRCPICGWANDPNVYSMKKFRGRWCHTICLDKALYFFLSRFDFRLGYNLRPVFCKRKQRTRKELSDEEIKILFDFLEKPLIIDK